MFIEPQMFLGILLNPLLEKKLDLIPPKKRDIFINEKGEFLQQLENNGSLYIGKQLEDSMKYMQLKNTTKHLQSILKLVLPDQIFNKTDILLITAPKK